ncbi:hypothetical protein [Sideroxydans sp. CL21]|nr:hypothetical protein [Sideroxydans sp. CL21]
MNCQIGSWSERLILHIDVVPKFATFQSDNTAPFPAGSTVVIFNYCGNINHVLRRVEGSGRTNFTGVSLSVTAQVFSFQRVPEFCIFNYQPTINEYFY